MTARELKENLLSFLSEEERIAQEEKFLISALSYTALESRGSALQNLKIIDKLKNYIKLECANNISKFREGDRVILLSEKGQTSGIIREIKESGTKFEVSCNTSRIEGKSITILESDEDIGIIYRMALSKLSEGTPGWWMLDVLEGNDRGNQILDKNKQDDNTYLADTLLEETNLDTNKSFHESLCNCLAKPRVLGIQGPPGTGKTVLLALAAEGFARKGMRIAITSQTHQAVNNALSILHDLFPERRICKLGNCIRRESLSDDIPSKILKDEFGNVDCNVLDSTIFGLTYASATIELCIKNSLFHPHVVLIDEAGQLPLAYACSMGLIGASSYIMFGDDCQMPPVFHTEPETSAYAVSVFEQYRKIQSEHVKQLQVTYRLNKEICEVVSSVFYEEIGLPPINPSHEAMHRNLNLSGSPDNTIGSKVLYNDKSVCWIDSPLGIDRDMNQWEASRIVEIVQSAINGGLSHFQIGVIIPFRRQVALIRKLLSKRLGDDNNLPIVDTVERLQGLTVDLILLSVTSSDTEYLSNIGSFLFSKNRLNVAVSRARSKVIIIGSSGLWKSTPSTLRGLEGQRIWKKLRDLFFVID